MTSIEILATLFAGVVLLKLILVTAFRELLMEVSYAILQNYVVTLILYLVAAAVVGTYVLASLSIVQVAAVMLWTSLLIGAGLAPYANFVLRWREEILSVGLKKAWPAILIWGAISLWVLFAVFTKSVS